MPFPLASAQPSGRNLIRRAIQPFESKSNSGMLMAVAAVEFDANLLHNPIQSRVPTTNLHSVAFLPASDVTSRNN